MQQTRTAPERGILDRYLIISDKREPHLTIRHNESLPRSERRSASELECPAIVEKKKQEVRIPFVFAVDSTP